MTAETYQTLSDDWILNMCKFVVAWVGNCPENGEPFCEKHSALKCCSCGEQATHNCEETMGLVCGCPLCDNCEHELSEKGTNGGTFAHCKKSDQKHVPWYVKDLIAKLGISEKDWLALSQDEQLALLDSKTPA